MAGVKGSGKREGDTGGGSVCGRQAEVGAPRIEEAGISSPASLGEACHDELRCAFARRITAIRKPIADEDYVAPACPEDKMATPIVQPDDIVPAIDHAAAPRQAEQGSRVIAERDDGVVIEMQGALAIKLFFPGVSAIVDDLVISATLVLHEDISVNKRFPVARLPRERSVMLIRIH